jgi:ParB family chromosome partitioning protein
MTKHLGFNAFLEPPVEVISTPLDQIVRDPDQPRKAFESESITALAESIGRFGLLQPILIGPQRPDGTYVILAGERRVRAARELAWETIPAIIRDESAINRIYVQGAENLARKNLEPIEILSLIEGLVAAGESQSDVARGLGMGRQTVNEYVAISRDAVARAALIGGASFRTVNDALRARKGAAAEPEPPAQDRDLPPATVTPIRPGVNRTEAPDPLDRDSPDAAVQPPPSDTASAPGPFSTGTDQPGGSTASTVSGADDDEAGPDLPGTHSADELSGNGPGPAPVEPVRVASPGAPVDDELARHMDEVALSSDDPAELADRAARCLAAGLAVASDLPEPQFTMVIEAHYRSLLRVRDMGSARP